MYGSSMNADPMDSYNAGYAARLQDALNGNSAMADTQAPPDASQPSDLGPDTYRNSALAPGQQTGPQPAPQQPQQPGPQGGGPGPQGGGPGPQGGGPGPQPAGGGSALAPQGQQAPPGKSAMDDSGQTDANGKKMTFRDVWQAQTKAARAKQVSDFEAQLAKGDHTISSAYDDMMKKLGTRPQTDLSKQDKAMLLMEFGLKMMRNSASPAQGGYGANVGAAAGAAGADTMQNAFQLRQQHQGQAHNWDVQQGQIGIAEGKEKANFAERSLLEAGRDYRANQNVDSRQNVVGQQQEGAGQRNDARISGQNTRAADALKQKDDQFFQAEAGRNSRAAGVQAGENSRASEKSALTAGGGARGAAMKTAYDLYMQVHGVDAKGDPLQGDDRTKAQQDALDFAANPSKAKMSNAQLMDMAEKDGNRQFAAGNLSTMGMTEDEVEQKKQAYINSRYQDLQSKLYGGGSGSAMAPKGAPGAAARPPSAMAPSAPRGTSAPPPAAGPAGAAPSARPDGKVAPPQALETLKRDPATAPGFLKRFGYVPPEFQKYLGPKRTSALQ